MPFWAIVSVTHPLIPRLGRAMSASSSSTTICSTPSGSAAPGLRPVRHQVTGVDQRTAPLWISERLVSTDELAVLRAVALGLWRVVDPRRTGDAGLYEPCDRRAGIPSPTQNRARAPHV